MKFKLEIELGNDAMQFYSDIRGALGDLNLPRAAKRPNLMDGLTIHDINGNRVGKWEIVEE